MKENNIVKYHDGPLERISSSINITKKLLSLINNNVLLIERTSTTPYISCNTSTGIFIIEGRSLPTYPADFYFPIIEWFDRNIISPKNDILFRFHLEYISADSEKVILMLLTNLINKAAKIGIKCSVDWYYDNDDDYILESGENIKRSLKAPFRLLQNNN